MDNLIKVENGVAQPYSIQQLRRENPLVSFPAVVPAEILNSHGVYEYIPADTSAINTLTHSIDRIWREVDGQWIEELVATALPAGEADRTLAAWRSEATLTRRQFCLACLRAGLLTPDDAVIAARGFWPPSFDAAISGLTPEQKAEAQIEWAAVSVIRRDAPLLAAVQATAGVTDEQLDGLFGWG